MPSPIVEAIKDHTNRQPHLLQCLCSRLWSRSQNPAEWQISPELLHLYDDQLADRFQADFNYLAPSERRLVRAILYDHPLPDDLPAAEVSLLLDRLTALGYLRRRPDQTYHIGNTFLLNWFCDSAKNLAWDQPNPQQPSDQATQAFYRQTTPEYNLRRLRKFVTQGFSDLELRRLCFEVPTFRPVYEQLSSDMGKDRAIQYLLEFAERQDLLKQLLLELRQINSAQYTAYYGTETPEMMDF